MTTRRILLIQGHPDASREHLCHALANAYVRSAQAAGHTVRTQHVAQLEFELLRSQKEWDEGGVPAGLQTAQDDIQWAEHIVLFFPLWLGDMPALLKGFLEQVARPGFAFQRELGGTAFTRKGLTGRSAHVIVTMGMPAPIYRWYFRGHSVKSLKRNILGFIGIAPVRDTLIGSVGSLSEEKVQYWLKRMGKWGRNAC